jgi:hypothetical protein
MKMLLKELGVICSSYVMRIYINGELQNTKEDFRLFDYVDYEVRRIEPSVIASEVLPISQGINIEPILKVFLNSKGE